MSCLYGDSLRKWAPSHESQNSLFLKAFPCLPCCFTVIPEPHCLLWQGKARRPMWHKNQTNAFIIRLAGLRSTNTTGGNCSEIPVTHSSSCVIFIYLFLYFLICRDGARSLGRHIANWTHLPSDKTKWDAVHQTEGTPGPPFIQIAVRINAIHL